MADVKDSKLSVVPSPVPSSKSPIPPVDSEEDPEVDPDAEMEDDPDVIRKTKLENFKYYTSLVLGTLCIVSIFAFLFLVPFVLDPAISTLMHEFVDKPVTCRVESVKVKTGRQACQWSSCREGCTADMFECWQVRVKYSVTPYVNDSSEVNHYIAEDQWRDLSRIDMMEEKMHEDTPLLVNIKGCGYPPDISCPAFAQKYKEMNTEGKYFPCYYSKLNPWIVMETYNFDETLYSIVASIVIPNGLFIISLIVLLYWHCPYCQARCRKYEEQMDFDERDDVSGLEDDDPQEPY